jgi:hypothetical protein
LGDLVIEDFEVREAELLWIIQETQQHPILRLLTVRHSELDVKVSSFQRSGEKRGGKQGG